jgi:DNA polymerase phi
MDIDDEISREEESDEESSENYLDNEETANEKVVSKDQSIIAVNQQDNENEEDIEDINNQDEFMKDLDAKLSEFFKHKKFEKKKKKGN